MITILLSLFALANSQITPIQRIAIPTGQVVLMSSIDLLTQSNYTIGYLTVNNSSACRRISMFKFPAINSGTVTQMVINTLSYPVPETCNIGFSLFYLNGTQVGTIFVGAFTDFMSRNTTELIIVNVTSTWSLVNGVSYYFIIQTTNTQASPCNIPLPVGMQIGPTGGITPAFALVVDKGPVNKPCGATPWTVQNVLNGGYIQMRLTGNLASPSVSVSASALALALAKNVSSPTSTYIRMNTTVKSQVNYKAGAPNTTPVGAIIGFILYITFIVIFVANVVNMRYHRIQASRSPVSSKTVINPTNGLIHESYNPSIRKISV